MKGKLIHSIAGLVLTFSLGVASAGPTPVGQNSADGSASAGAASAMQTSPSAGPFSAVLGSANYEPMSNQELSRVNGKQVIAPVLEIAAGVAAASDDPQGPVAGQVLEQIAGTVPLPL